jgi:hypothetical protein
MKAYSFSPLTTPKFDVEKFECKHRKYISNETFYPKLIFQLHLKFHQTPSLMISLICRPTNIPSLILALLILRNLLQEEKPTDI